MGFFGGLAKSVYAALNAPQRLDALNARVLEQQKTITLLTERVIRLEVLVENRYARRRDDSNDPPV
ncbi:hypothetical protein ABT364_26745 [Massilia sp. SR12]